MVWGQAITATWFYFAWPELFAVCALEGLTLVGEEHGIVGDIREALGEEVVEDEVAVVAVRKSGGKLLVSSEWAETDGLIMFRGKIYVPDVKDLRWQIVAQHHDTQIAGHPGCWKTLELVTCKLLVAPYVSLHW